MINIEEELGEEEINLNNGLKEEEKKEETHENELHEEKEEEIENNNCLEKCSEFDEESNKLILCKKCNNKKGNFPLNTGMNSKENIYINCLFYHYYVEYEKQYKCTENLKCPNEYQLLIKNKSECISDCKKDEKFKYEFKVNVTNHAQ